VLADKIARRGKAGQHAIIRFDKNPEGNMAKLQQMLLDRTYFTSPYTHFTLHDPKERLISSLPYRDRIAHHAIMNVLEPMFVGYFTGDTYSCIKGRGIHAASEKLKNALRHDLSGTRYCLKLDIKKFYPSIDHAVLKNLLRRKIKDQDVLWLLDEIIDSAPGVPIGNYLSQYFANFYLGGLDHWIKQNGKVRHYFRYADDMVILAGSKSELHQILAEISVYLNINLKLEVKNNYQVFKVAERRRLPGAKACKATAGRAIDFLGYLFYKTQTLLRKTIKQSWARAIERGCTGQSIAAFEGWACHCDSLNLKRKFNARRKTIQRVRYQVQGDDRRKDPDRADPWKIDHRNRFQDRAKQVRPAGQQTDLFAVPARGT